MRRIKDSISLKVFLGMSVALIIGGLIIYAIIMFSLPQRYQVMLDERLEQNLESLAERLGDYTFDEAESMIYEFCIENQTVGDLGTLDEDNTFTSLVTFGDYEAGVQSENGITITSQLFFRGDSTPYLFIVVDSTTTTETLTTEFLKLLPFAVAAIVVISLFGAWVCSRWFVRPVQELSHISQRLAQLDMTWECDDARTDEVGILARNLNSMSKRLKAAMDDLEKTNRLLSEEVHTVTALEKERRDFFTAVSHELKTPLAVLRAQLESMNLNIGDYADHQKYLPQTLQSVDAIEQLVGEILLIVKLESQWGHEISEEVEIPEVVETCLAKLTPLAEQKSVTIKNEISDPIWVESYPHLAELALSNILTNAVVHAPESTVVSIQMHGRTLLVENKSDVMTDEDLCKMFEPFYRLDASRSRDTGGSGLGLYVVTTILAMIDWRYHVSYHEGVFTFAVELPAPATAGNASSSPSVPSA